MELEKFVKNLASTLKNITTAKSADTKLLFNKKFFLLLSIIILLLLFLLFTFITLSESGSPAVYSTEELRAILYLLDGKSWKCSKTDRSKVGTLFSIESSGSMTSERFGSEGLIITMDDGSSYYCSIGDGCYLIEAGNYTFPMYYSEKGSLFIIFKDIKIEWTKV